MNKEEINKLIELLEELQNKEYFNDDNIVDNEEIEHDVYTCTDVLINFLQKNYIIQNIDAWKIKK